MAKRDEMFVELRKRAQEVLEEHACSDRETTDTDLFRLIKQIEINQMALELQNAELRRKRIELEDFRNEFYDFYDLAPVGFVTLDRKGMVTRVNRMGKEMLAVSGEVLIGKAFSKWIPAKDHNLYFSCLQKADNFRERQTCAVHLCPKKGDVIYVRIEVSAYLDEAKNLIEWRLALSDITRQNLTEQALRQNEDRYRSLFESMDEGFVVGKMLYDKRGKPCDYQFIEVNAAYERITGISREASLKKTIKQLIPTLEQEWIENPARVVESGEPMRRESYGRNTGKIFEIYTYRPGPGLFASVFSEITERKRAEEALQQSEQHLRDMLNKIIAMVGVLNADGILIEANRIALEAADLKLEDVLGKPFEECYWWSWSPEVQKRLGEAIKRAAAGEGSRYDEVVRIGKGEFRTIDFMIAPMFGPDDRISCLITSAADISDRKQAEEELRKSRDELELRVQDRTAELDRRAAQLARLSSQLTLAEQRERRRLAVIVHDHIQQLLVGIKIHLEVLAVQIGNEHQREFGKIYDLLTQTLKAACSLGAEMAPYILYERGLAPGLEWLAQNMLETYQLEIESQIDQNIMVERDDLRVLLFESVRELLINVIKHAHVSSASIRMFCDDEDNLRIMVSDQGVGFDPDKRCHNDCFGLFSIRERLGFVGGKLEIESSPGHGAVLNLILPMDKIRHFEGPLEIREISSRDDVGALPQTGQKIRVLLVDDHAVVRQGLSSLLHAHSDIEVVGEAENGEAAIKMAQKLQPDVILMDISMPKMDGIEATRIIHSELPGVRIIGLSMYDDSETAKGMLNAGAAAFASKSGATDVLLSAIRGNQNQTDI